MGEEGKGGTERKHKQHFRPDGFSELNHRKTEPTSVPMLPFCSYHLLGLGVLCWQQGIFFFVEPKFIVKKEKS
jgi:hypothetical protein